MRGQAVTCGVEEEKAEYTGNSVLDSAVDFLLYESTLRENPEEKKRLLNWAHTLERQTGGAFFFYMNDRSANGRRVSRFLLKGKELNGLFCERSFDYAKGYLKTRAGGAEKIIKLKTIDTVDDDIPVRVELKNKESAVIIRIEANGERCLPKGLLLPTDPSHCPIVKDPVKKEEKKCWEIRFDNVPDGEFYFLFEPRKWSW